MLCANERVQSECCAPMRGCKVNAVRQCRCPQVKRRGANPYLRPLANLLSLLVPTWPLAATNKNTMVG